MAQLCTCSLHSLIGVSCIVVGLLVWRLQRLNYIFDKHCANIAESDVGAYTALFGKALLCLGTGVLAAGIMNLFTPWGWALCAAGFIAFTALAVTAQLRYNGGIFR